MSRFENNLTTRPDHSRRRRPAIIADAFEELNPKDLQRITDVAIADIEAGVAHSKMGMMLVPSETGVCNECCCMIPHHCMTSKILDRRSGEPLRREIKGYCEFCSVLHAQTLELRGGVWTPIGATAHILHGPSKETFLGSIRELLAHYAGKKAC